MPRVPDGKAATAAETGSPIRTSSACGDAAPSIPRSSSDTAPTVISEMDPPSVAVTDSDDVPSGLVKIYGPPSYAGGVTAASGNEATASS